MSMKELKKYLSGLSPNDRLKLAQEKIEKVVGRLRAHLQVHATNQIILYTGTLADQIPKSYAGHAFNSFQHVHFSGELVSLCALWDGRAKEKNNILTVVELVSDNDVKEAAAVAARQTYADVPMRIKGEDEIDLGDALERWQNGLAEKEYNKVLTALREGISLAEETGKSDLLVKVMNYRDKELAHSLDVTRREKSRTIRPPKYGDEEELLKKTTEVITKLYFGICHVSYNFEDSMRIAEKRAAELWSSCKFDIPV